MKYYPVCLHIEGRKCLVVGGGRVAERKIRGLLDCKASVHVVSPQVTEGVAQLAASGDIEWSARGYERGEVAGCFLVMAATDSQQVQDQVQQDAVEHNVLLNVADVPDKCNFILPAQVKRGALSITVSTSGKSPALAKLLRRQIGDQFGAEYGLLNEIMGMLRPEILARGLSQQENEVIFSNILDSDMLTWIRNEDWSKVARHISECSGLEWSVEAISSLV